MTGTGSAMARSPNHRVEIDLTGSDGAEGADTTPITLQTQVEGISDIIFLGGAMVALT